MITESERKVLAMLLAGEDPTLVTLRCQLSSATVTSRKFTGHGFFTHFHIPEHVPRIPKSEQVVIGDIAGELSGVPCGFLLFVKNGALSVLEGYVYGDDKWPTAALPDRLHYMRQRTPGSPSIIETSERDHAAIQAKLSE